MRNLNAHRRTLVALAAMLLLAAGSASLALAETAAAPEATYKQMLAALQSGSVDQFVAEGDAAFKAAMTKPMLEHVSGRLAPRLAKGYTSTYLGRLSQQGFAVHLWKLEFKDGGDDVLVTMSVKDGKVGGFWLR